jgi:hypothetical protein
MTRIVGNVGWMRVGWIEGALLFSLRDAAGSEESQACRD